MSEEKTIPNNDMRNTKPGYSGKIRTHAIIRGVEGIRVKPRRIEIRK